jgi:hypothetical protein
MTDITIRSDEDEFQTALQGEDELGVVVRAHIYIEASLNELLEELSASIKHIEKMNLEYSQRVSLAVAIGLLPQYESPLRAIGTLRNNFAHKTGTKLTKDRVNNLYASLSSEDKQIVQSSYERTRKKVKTQIKVPTFSKLPPKSQFILIAVSIRSLLIVATREAREVKRGA